MILTLEERVSKLEKFVKQFESYESWIINPSGDFINLESDNPDDQISEVDEYVSNKICKSLNISDDDYFDIISSLDDDNHSGDLSLLFNKLIKTGKGLIPSKTLYRGCSEKEYDSIVKTGHSPFTQAMSFSENKEAAQKFGKYLLEVNFETPAFPTWYLVLYKYNTYKKSLSKKAYKLADNIYDITYDLSLVESESEWQVPANTTFEVLDDGTFIASNNKNSNKLESNAEALIKFAESNKDTYYNIASNNTVAAHICNKDFIKPGKVIVTADYSTDKVEFRAYDKYDRSTHYLAMYHADLTKMSELEFDKLLMKYLNANEI